MADDAYKARVNKAAHSEEAYLLRQNIADAVDAYMHFFAKHGLHVNISWSKESIPGGDALIDVVQRDTWLDFRARPRRCN